MDQYSTSSYSVPLSSFSWIHPPKEFKISEDSVEITTDPETDYWQRTYYGF